MHAFNNTTRNLELRTLLPEQESTEWPVFQMKANDPSFPRLCPEHHPFVVVSLLIVFILVLVLL